MPSVAPNVRAARLIVSYIVERHAEKPGAPQSTASNEELARAIVAHPSTVKRGIAAAEERQWLTRTFTACSPTLQTGRVLTVLEPEPDE